ncbi:OB-fold nucleic acid binding domain-containing protein, partial [Bartonella capreoli]
NLIHPLFASVRTLQGISPPICALLAKVLNINPTQREPTLIDLLQLMPHSVIDRRICPSIAFAQEGITNTLEIIIDQHQPPPIGRSRSPYRVIAHDQTGKINLVFFHAHCSWLKKQLPEGRKVVVSGKVERFNGQL